MIVLPYIREMQLASVGTPVGGRVADPVAFQRRGDVMMQLDVLWPRRSKFR